MDLVPTFSVLFFFCKCRSSSECWRPLAATRRWSSRWGDMVSDFLVSHFDHLDLGSVEFHEGTCKCLGPHERPFRVTVQGGVCRVCVVKKASCSKMPVRLRYSN